MGPSPVGVTASWSVGRGGAERAGSGAGPMAGRRGAARDPEATLRQRFARGEISEAELERGRTVLRETARRALR